MTFGLFKSAIEENLFESYKDELQFKKSIKEFKQNILTNKSISKVKIKNKKQYLYYMSYIIKNTAALINTLMTDAARKKISQGRFDISYFQVGDSEVCYNCVNGMNQSDSYVLMPQDNGENPSPAPEKNRMHVKQPLY